MFAKFVPAQPGICGFEIIVRAQFLQFVEAATRGGVIMQGTELRRKRCAKRPCPLHFNQQVIVIF
ncbi:MAG: hypothetical protein CEE38_15035 [Planctomycetes bacterium B3_Pla]|nr:MAG: hypothetical protein CEE38_15035 [Planctomycetes bacterium B3_Pla]